MLLASDSYCRLVHSMLFDRCVGSESQMLELIWKMRILGTSTEGCIGLHLVPYLIARGRSSGSTPVVAGTAAYQWRPRSQ